MNVSSKPLFTLIVPVYNVEPFLEECLNSIKNQTFNDFECVVVDDGSTDNSSSICDKYANEDKRFRCVHKINGGLSDARNAGIEKAQGEYVLFIDSDDYISIRTLEVFVIYIQRYNTPDMICLGLESFGVTSYTYPFVKDETYIEGSRAVQKSYYERKWYEMAVNKVVKLKTITDNALYFRKGMKHEDTLWSYQLTQVVKTLVLVPETTYFYRIRPQSIITSITTIENIAHMMEVIRLMIDFSEQQQCLNKESKWYLMDFIVDFVVSNICKGEIAIEQKKNAYRKVIKEFQRIRSVSFLFSDYSKGVKLFALFGFLPHSFGFYLTNQIVVRL